MDNFTIFNYSRYRDYIEDRLKGPEFGRGGKAKLAEHLSCQPSFISQVLKEKSSFNLEQAYKINYFLKHNVLEKEYFMNLIEIDRAGTLELKSYFEEKRLILAEKSKLIENQMAYDELSERDTVAYYNNWNHILIRNLIDIPQYKSLPALKRKLLLPEGEFEAALKFLLEKKLIRFSDKDELEQGHARLHIKKDSPLAKYANITARLQMIKNYEKTSYKDINYGAYMTLPKASYEEFKTKLKALITDLNHQLEEKSEAETMVALIIDCMEL